MIFILLKFNIISFILTSHINLYIKFLLAYILLVLLSALVSYFTFTFIEKPGIVLGKKLIKKISS
jgi:peptidoglycan/LPS O-acetylase OafA/YrhL